MKKIFTLILILFEMGMLLTGYHNALGSVKGIEAVQKQYESQLMSIPGVVGVGIGECNGQPCLKVFVTKKTPELEQQIPKQLEGFKVDIEVGGQPESQ